MVQLSCRIRIVSRFGNPALRFLLLVVGLSLKADAQTASSSNLGAETRQLSSAGSTNPEVQVSSSVTSQTPDVELASFQLSDPSLVIELVASEPDVRSPVAFAWDADGRLFVAEMIGYPAVDGQCRIALLEKSGEGSRYKRVSTFVDGLSYVNSVMPYRRGLLALSAPDLLYFEDTDGDGKADLRRVELTGFGTGSQQLRANSLHWGLDNWIYGANGRCDGEIRRPDDSSKPPVSIRTRDFRFSPDAVEFEALLGQSQFGQVHDDWGHRFLSWNTIPIRHVLLEESELGGYQSGVSAAVVNVAEPSDTGQIFPISPPPRQFNAEQANYYNAMCGLCVYRGDALGHEYLGNAFVCESLTNLVTRRVLEPKGPSFVSRRPPNESGQEFLASRDNWFHPVNLSTGPDGALYVADFYREFVEHPIYVANLKTRAETDWRKGSECGRIWRVRSKSEHDNQALQQPRLSKASSAELVALLAHSVGWWRDTAQRLLYERQDRTSVPLLRQQLRESRSALGRSHSLWTLSGLESLSEPDLMIALADPEPAVRRQAMRSIGRRQITAIPVVKSIRNLSRDPNQELRFQLALTARQLPAEEAIGVLSELLNDEPSPELQSAVLCSSSSLQPWSILRSLVTNESWRSDLAPWKITLIEQMAEQVALLPSNKLSACLEWLQSQSKTPITTVSLAVLNGLSKGLESKGTSLVRVVAEPESIWNTLVQSLSAYRDATIHIATDHDASLESRRCATDLLGQLPGAEQSQLLISFLRDDTERRIQIAATRSIANCDDSELFGQVFSEWQRLSTVVRRDLLNALGRAPSGVPAILEAIENGHLTVNELPNPIRDAATKHRDPAIRERAEKLFSTLAIVDRNDVIKRYLPVVTLHGSAEKGAAIFKQNCLVCHAVRGVGQRVGPDLAGVSSRRRDNLVVDILDPSRQVTPDFIAYSLVTRQGRVFAGMIAAETADAVTIRRERGEQDTILRTEIEELRGSNKSVMPDGFENKLTLEQMSDLLEFLSRPDTKLLIGE